MVAIEKNVALTAYSSMRLGGYSAYMCTVRSEQDLIKALEYAKFHQLPVVVIGHGTNVIWRDEGFNGLLIAMAIDGYTHNEKNHSFRFNAGMAWDTAVNISIEQGYSGLECLSMIPGTVGATPIQNVGAYGTEIKDVLTQVRVYDTVTEQFTFINAGDCDFGYRTSRFKYTDRGRYIITAIDVALSQQQPQPPFYESLQAYLDEHQITDYSPLIIRRAVMAIRSSKLPDPTVVANNGSFFANPVITKDEYNRLKRSYPDIKGWELADGHVKIAAGWLIERAGYKDFHDPETGMATWPQQSLVLINEHAHSTKDVLAFRDAITHKIKTLFNIDLVQEPELLP